MTFARVDSYDCHSGKISNYLFRVQIYQAIKYLVDWNKLTNPWELTYKIERENILRRSALANSITNSGLIYLLKESYETQLDPRAFEENAPLRSLSQLFS